MKLIIVIVIILVSFILNFLIKKYVRLSMVILTMFYTGLMTVVDSILLYFIFFSELSDEFPLTLKLIIIFVVILPFIFLKNYLSHTARILDYWINKKKILENGYLEKGNIEEIKFYGFHRHSKDGYYLIVNFNGEKIKSIPFRNTPAITFTKTTYEIDTSYSKKEQKVMTDIPPFYNVGDEIDVIIYKNKKYVKLKDF